MKLYYTCATVMKIDQNSRAKVNELWLNKPLLSTRHQQLMAPGATIMFKTLTSHIVYGLQPFGSYDTGIAFIYYA